MKPPLSWLLSAAVIALFIRGFVSISTSTDTYTQSEARTPALIAGIACVGVGTGLLVLGIWVSRKHD